MYWSTPVASFSSGLISYGIDKNLDGAYGIASWKWLFIIESVPTVVFGLAVIFLLPSLPDQVAKKGHFLFRSQQEKEILLSRFSAGKAEFESQRSSRMLTSSLSINSTEHPKREDQEPSDHRWSEGPQDISHFLDGAWCYLRYHFVRTATANLHP